MVQKIVISGLLLLLINASGIWLSKLGKPYHGALFNVHKLIALGSVIFIGVFLYNLLKVTEVDGVLLTLVIVSIVSILVLFISGALLSAGVGPYTLMKIIHSIITIAAVGAIAGTIYLTLYV
jgi:hypothetical protein